MYVTRRRDGDFLTTKEVTMSTKKGVEILLQSYKTCTEEQKKDFSHSFIQNLAIALQTGEITSNEANEMIDRFLSEDKN